MNYIFLIQARSSSTRFPKKVLSEITEGKTLIEAVYERIKIADEASADNIWVLIPKGKKNDDLAKFLKKKNIPHWRGPEEDVYLRFLQFLNTQKTKPDYLFRICSDNPFIEPLFIEKVTDFLNKSKDLPDYISYKDSSGKPAILTHSGFFCEAVKYSAFIEAQYHITNDEQKMHVTPIFYKNNKFKAKFLAMPKFNSKYLRCTIDTKEDFDIAKDIYKLVKNKEKFSYKDILDIIYKNPKFITFMIENIKKNKK